MNDPEERTIFGTPPLQSESRLDYDRAFKRSMGEPQPGDPPLATDRFDGASIAGAFMRGIIGAVPPGAVPYTHTFVPELQLMHDVPFDHFSIEWVDE